MKTALILVLAVYLTPAAVLALLVAREPKRPAPTRVVHTCDVCAGIDPLLARMDMHLWSIELEGAE